jgi:hypothetical protein
MKKILVIISFVGIYFMNGCVSYRGSPDFSISLSEQATLLTYPQELWVTEFNGKTVVWRGDAEKLYVNIPSGEHTLTLNYSSSQRSNFSQYESSLNTYITYTVTTKFAEGLKVTAMFEAGNTYVAVPRLLSDNKVMVEIVLIEKGKPKDSYSFPEFYITSGFGVNSASLISGNFGFKTGKTFIKNTRTALNYEMGMGVGVLGPIPLGIELLAGGNYEMFFNKESTIGLSLGGGFAYSVFSMYPYLMVKIPILRKDGSRLSIYGTYYLTDAAFFEPTRLGNSDDPSRFNKNIGFGLQWSDK